LRWISAIRPCLAGVELEKAAANSNTTSTGVSVDVGQRRRTIQHADRKAP